MECVELAPAVGCVARFESGGKLHALHTLRAVWFRLCRPEDRRALPAVTDRLGEISRDLRRELCVVAQVSNLSVSIEIASFRDDFLCKRNRLGGEVPCVARFPIRAAELWNDLCYTSP